MSKSLFYLSENSFENIKIWLKELRTHANPNIIIFLIGNKVDLEGKRVIEYQKALKFSENEGFKLFLESSAKTGFNAQKIFIEAGKELLKNYQEYANRRSSKTSSLDGYDLYNSRVKFPSEVNQTPGKEIKKNNSSECKC